MNIENSHDSDAHKYFVESITRDLCSLRSTAAFAERYGLDVDEIISQVCGSNSVFKFSLQKFLKSLPKLSPKILKHDYPKHKTDASGQIKGSVYFDFAKKKLVYGGKEEPIRDNQLSHLIQQGIRHQSVHYSHGFLGFKEWRLKKEEFKPKRLFENLICDTNNFLRRFGLEFTHAGETMDIWGLTGWDDARHRSNISDARVLVKKVVVTLKTKPANWRAALDTALKASQLDPDSLSAAFYITKCVRKLKNAEVPANILKGIYRLLRQQENVYTDAIVAIEGCKMLRDADVGKQLRKYRGTLRKIKQHRKLTLKLPQWSNVYDDKELFVDKLIKRIRAIRENYKNGKSSDQTKDLHILCNLDEIQKAKNAVIARIVKCCRRTGDYIEERDVDFDACFTELILMKVDCAKLEYPGSLALYCKKTIPSMLLDGILRDKYGLSYSQFADVRRMRRAKQAIYQRFDREPTDEQVTSALKIKLPRLRLIRQWEQQLTAYSFDEELDHDPSRPEQSQSP